MPRIVQAKCPGCQQFLRIPADWLHQTMRCKHCGLTFQVQPKATSGRAAAPAPPHPEPAHPEPAPQDTFAALADGPVIRLPQQHRRSRRSWWLSVLVVVSVLAAGITVALAFLHGLPLIHDWIEHPAASNSAPAVPSQGLPAEGAFPRRALAISVNHYLYANPVSYGIPGRNVRTVLERLSRVLHIPSSQLVELSDGAAGLQARAPLKPVLEKTITDFLATARAQDRLLVLFVGHAVVLDDKAYLVPLEGELTVPQTLLPLSWLYERLAECKARQKVLILDVCRFDPSRGPQRPGSEPMSAALAAALHQPPAGVQVWTACTAEQYSHEIEGVGVFLDQLAEAVQPGAFKLVQQPPDPLPLEALAEMVHKSTAREVQTLQHAEQTPRLVGQEPAGGAPFNAQELLPARLVLPLPPTPAGGLAPPSDIQRLLHEIELPSVNLGPEEPFQVETLLPFSAQVLADYPPDYQALADLQAKDANGNAKFPLRAAVLEAIELLRTGGKITLRERFSKASNPTKFKEEIRQEQMQLARTVLLLSEARNQLEEAGKELGNEPSKRWQAHYHYIQAQLLARLAFVQEYNLMLGKIRRDELPELKENVHNSWRLAAREKLQSSKEMRDLAEQARRIWAELAKNHPGTPWEVLAKRARLTALGLEWLPAR